MIILILLIILIVIGLYTIIYPEYPRPHSKHTKYFNTSDGWVRTHNGRYHARITQPIAHHPTVNDLRKSCGLDRGY